MRREAAHARSHFAFAFSMLTFKIKNDGIPESERIQIPDQLMHDALAAAGDDLPTHTELLELIEQALTDLIPEEKTVVCRGTSREEASASKVVV